jgi:hypothetical protein
VRSTSRRKEGAKGFGTLLLDVQFGSFLVVVTVLLLSFPIF